MKEPFVSAVGLSLTEQEDTGSLSPSWSAGDSLPENLMALPPTPRLDKKDAHTYLALGRLGTPPRSAPIVTLIGIACPRLQNAR